MKNRVFAWSRRSWRKKNEWPPLNKHFEIKPAATTSARNYGDQVKPKEPESATESDADETVDKKMGDFLSSSSTGPSKQDENKMDDSSTPAPVAKVKAEPSSGFDSSPHRPTKRPKPKISSDEDSESDNKPRNVAGTSSGATRRGAAPRQPIKRGGKRF